MKKIKKVSIDNFKSLELTNQNDLKGGGTGFLVDSNPDPCTKWKCDSTCRCSDSVKE